MLALAFAGKCLESIPRRKPKVGETSRCIDGEQPAPCHAVELRRKRSARELGINTIPDILRGLVCELHLGSPYYQMPIIPSSDNVLPAGRRKTDRTAFLFTTMTLSIKGSLARTAAQRQTITPLPQSSSRAQLGRYFGET